MNNITEAKRRYIIKVNPFVTQGPQGPKGDKGDGVELLLPLSTDDITYRGNNLTTILDGILYVPLNITSFNANQLVYEKGQILTSLMLTWGFNKTIQTQSITGSNLVSPTLIATDRNKTVVLNNITSNTAITLSADEDTGDSNPPKTSIITLQFLNKVYWGKRNTGTFNSAFILSLTNSELRSNRQKSFTLNAGAGEYIWFASPVAYGEPAFVSNGFSGGFIQVATFNFTNASGYIENYYLYRSLNPNVGNTAVDVI